MQLEIENKKDLSNKLLKDLTLKKELEAKQKSEIITLTTQVEKLENDIKTISTN